MSNNRYGVNMNIIAQKLLHNSIYTMKSTKVQTLGGDERTCYRRFYVSKVEEDWPTQTSVKGSRRGKHATKRGPFFAVYLLCFSSTIGLVNVLCRIVAYVRTGYVTEIISRMQEQIAKGLGMKPVCGSTRMCCTANWWVGPTDSWSPTKSLRVGNGLATLPDNMQEPIHAPHYNLWCLQGMQSKHIWSR